MIKPHITILIASFNRLNFLKKSLKSALNQDYPYFDILIIDDGSEDDTRDWLMSMSKLHNSISLHFQENQGVAKARQVGLELSKGEYICILDSDDLLKPQAFSLVYNYIIKMPEIDLFYSNNIELYSNGKKITSNYTSFSDNRKFMKAIFTRPRIPFKHSGTTFKRIKAIKIGGYDEKMRSKVDIDFLVRALTKGFQCELIRYPIVVFSFHRNSISRSNRIKGLKVWWQIIDKYSSEHYMVRLIDKFTRTLFEFLKFGFEIIRMK